MPKYRFANSETEIKGSTPSNCLRTSIRSRSSLLSSIILWTWAKSSATAALTNSFSSSPRDSKNAFSLRSASSRSELLDFIHSSFSLKYSFLHPYYNCLNKQSNFNKDKEIIINHKTSPIKNHYQNKAATKLYLIPLLNRIIQLKYRYIPEQYNLLVVLQELLINFAQNKNTMTFDDITGDGRLWAVKYVGETENELYKLFDQWNDVIWLRNFLKQT